MTETSKTDKRKTPEFRAASRASMLKLLARPGFPEKLSARMRALNANSEFKKAHTVRSSKCMKKLHEDGKLRWRLGPKSLNIPKHFYNKYRLIRSVHGAHTAQLEILKAMAQEAKRVEENPTIA